jgi:hypothetical protein
MQGPVVTRQSAPETAELFRRVHIAQKSPGFCFCVDFDMRCGGRAKPYEWWERPRAVPRLRAEFTAARSPTVCRKWVRRCARVRKARGSLDQGAHVRCDHGDNPMKGG